MTDMIYSSMVPLRQIAGYASKAVETHNGTTTSWLPLITAPPTDSRCSSHLYSPDGAHHTLVACDPHLEAVANITCLPREAVEWYTQNNLPYGATTGVVTSLGPMICPDGYTTASTSKKDRSSTMVFCCPSNYNFATSTDHGNLYECISMQAGDVTVHISGATPPVTTLATGDSSRALTVAGIAVNGWTFEPSPLSALGSPTATMNSDIWAEEHLGMSTAAVAGIMLGGTAGIMLLGFLLGWCFTTKRFSFKRRSDEEGARYGCDGTRDPSTSDDHQDFNASRDIELSDLNASGVRVPSAADTVVQHIKHSKSEGSNASGDMTA
ncbi:hypothetical protein EPUS_04822 [Endocarpon pusillum Z07020]|uniref:Uncharacterized protein n=1 Tax=Endocarpon pusillum (strain Z07020 / HMAS-L-300199) TaxID=1263415 RepID=U1HWA7_ENDPU|nr:uncharacterized protein EPUS_04822 [Endocarpon pusillum Z07020]ERF75040.1 hypothetical protein EPUS_04822 [Endocarpon pusillum Z07020]